MSRLVSFLFAIFTLSLFSSCSNALEKMAGYKSYHTRSNEYVIAEGKKMGIPETKAFRLDAIKHWETIRPYEKLYPVFYKNSYQLAQALFFNEGEILLCHHANCYAPGFPNLNWNKFGTFDQYPPKPVAKIDTSLSFSEFSNNLVQLLPDSKPASRYKGKNLLVVVWSEILLRQSKRLIKEVQAYEEKFDDEDFEVIYVYGNDLFAEDK